MNDSRPRAILEAHELTCIRDDRTLFSDLSFGLAAAQVLLIEGRNGSGKTSLLRILCGIRLPDGGKVTWSGEDIFKMGSGYHAYTAYIGHKDGVKLDLTVLENLTFAKNLGSPADIDLEQALEEMNLADFLDVPAYNLSAGQKRRLALARLLVTQSQLWILDEPFTSLDRHGIAVIEGLILRHLERGGMLAVTSHHQVQLPDADIQPINLSQ